MYKQVNVEFSNPFTGVSGKSMRAEWNDGGYIQAAHPLREKERESECSRSARTPLLRATNRPTESAARGHGEGRLRPHASVASRVQGLAKRWSPGYVNAAGKVRQK